MNNVAFIAIDTDISFLERFKIKLDELGVLQEYQFITIELRATDIDEMVNQVTREINKHLQTGVQIEAVFTDIVILENGNIDREDRSGIQIAKHVRTMIPGTPVIAMTHYIKDYRLISEISFESSIDGLLLKLFIIQDQFTRPTFLRLIKMAKEKAQTTVQTKDELGSLPTGPAFSVKAKRSSGIVISNDPRTLHQVHEIGEPRLDILLADLFPGAQGTITAIRPGFSGSYIFKVSAKTGAPNLSPSQTRSWIMKVSDHPEKLQNEIERCKEVRKRVHGDLYPNLVKDTVTKAEKWAALGLEMKDDTIVLSEYLSQLPPADQIRPLLLTCLTNFLKQHYGAPIEKRTFVWQEFYKTDDWTKTETLYFIEEAMSKRHSAVETCRDCFKRVQKFVESDGKTEPAVYNMDADVSTSYIHGDLNGRNILTTLDYSKLVFIDFADSNQDHSVKDIANLEADFLFLTADSVNWYMSDWARLPFWTQILGLYNRDTLFTASSSCTKDSKDKSVQHTCEVISLLRQCLNKLLPGNGKEKQYLVALIYYGLHYLSYPNVTYPKKVFGIQWLNHLFKQLETG